VVRLGCRRVWHAESAFQCHYATKCGRLLDAKPQVKALAEMVNEDTLVTAAENYSGYRKYVPAFLETFEFKATGSKNPVLAAVKVLQDAP
jgi:hypothetical protein